LKRRIHPNLIPHSTSSFVLRVCEEREVAKKGANSSKARQIFDADEKRHKAQKTSPKKTVKVKKQSLESEKRPDT